MRTDGAAIVSDLDQAVVDITRAFDRMTARDDLKGKDREKVRKALGRVDDQLGKAYVLYHTQ